MMKQPNLTQEAGSEKDPFEGYEPFGEQWKKELMRMTKKDIVELFASALNPDGDSFFIVREDMTQAIGKIVFADNCRHFIDPGLPLYPIFRQDSQGKIKKLCYYPVRPSRQKEILFSTGSKTNL